MRHARAWRLHLPPLQQRQQPLPSCGTGAHKPSAEVAASCIWPILGRDPPRPEDLGCRGPACTRRFGSRVPKGDRPHLLQALLQALDLVLEALLVGLALAARGQARDIGLRGLDRGQQGHAGQGRHRHLLGHGLLGGGLDHDCLAGGGAAGDARGLGHATLSELHRVRRLAMRFSYTVDEKRQWARRWEAKTRSRNEIRQKVSACLRPSQPYTACWGLQLGPKHSPYCCRSPFPGLRGSGGLKPADRPVGRPCTSATPDLATWRAQARRGTELEAAQAARQTARTRWHQPAASWLLLPVDRSATLV